LLAVVAQSSKSSPLLGLSVRHARFKELNEELPKPGVGGYYRRTVHYPEKYTIKPVPYTNLAGRDPVSGRVIVGTLGGGIKWPLLWVDYVRTVPEGMEGPLVERVLQIIPEPTRTAHVALVGHSDKLRYIIATAKMKEGDLITTSTEVTRIAVRANEGDAYPLGSLPVNSKICCVEMTPGSGGFYARGAGTSCTILRKVGQRVIIMIPSKREMSLDQNCMAVVGRCSNVIWNTIHIGSPNNLRHMGYRPRSGLWQRKTGKHGRKLRRPPPCREIVAKELMIKKSPRIKLTLDEDVWHCHFRPRQGTY